ncbi:hypothetical protein ACQJBY_044689 [Aegilops geniculata]
MRRRRATTVESEEDPSEAAFLGGRRPGPGGGCSAGGVRSATTVRGERTKGMELLLLSNRFFIRFIISPTPPLLSLTGGPSLTEPSPAPLSLFHESPAEEQRRRPAARVSKVRRRRGEREGGQGRAAGRRPAAPLSSSLVIPPQVGRMRKGLHPQMQWISYVTQSGRLINITMTKVNHTGKVYHMRAKRQMAQSLGQIAKFKRRYEQEAPEENQDK